MRRLQHSLLNRVGGIYSNQQSSDGQVDNAQIDKLARTNRIDPNNSNGQVLTSLTAGVDINTKLLVRQSTYIGL